MKQIRVKRIYYHLKHRYFTLNNVVLLAALLVAFGWAWGSVSIMQRNYALQRKVDNKARQLTLTKLEVQTLEFEKRYHASGEYQELAARQSLGLANPGEKVLVLPPNSKQAINYDSKLQEQPIVPVDTTTPSNIEQWLTFLLGGNAKSLKD